MELSEPRSIDKCKMTDLSADLQPRELLQQYGAAALSTVDLLAILLGSGVQGFNVKAVANSVLESFGGIQGLSRATFEDIYHGEHKIKGIGKTKATILAAAFELGRRFLTPSADEFRHPLNSPREACSFIAKLLLPEVSRRDQECFWVIHLNSRRVMIGTRATQISVGLLNRTLADVRTVFRGAVHTNAHSIIVVHNHPSGDVEPSEQDLITTKLLINAGKTLGINLTDHIILGTPDVVPFAYSMREHSRCQFED